MGVALLLGVAMRTSAVAGATLFVLMWTAVLPPAKTPLTTLSFPVSDIGHDRCRWDKRLSGLDVGVMCDLQPEASDGTMARKVTMAAKIVPRIRTE